MAKCPSCEVSLCHDCHQPVDPLMYRCWPCAERDRERDPDVQRARDLEAELSSLRGELATIFGVAKPRTGETQNAACLRVVGAALAKEQGERDQLHTELLGYRQRMSLIRWWAGDSSEFAKKFDKAGRDHFPLEELARELRTQNNRITADPLFIVQQERKVWGMEEGYSDEFEWYHADLAETFLEEDAIEEVRARDSVELDDDEEIDLEDHGYRKVFYTKYWDFVTAHFTEKAAQRYLDQNAHNLSNPRVYVTSQYRCDEWNRVRRFLMEGVAHARAEVKAPSPLGTQEASDES